MTAHPNRRPQRPDRQPVRCDSTTPATHDDAPRVAAAVPIAVWRLDDHDDASLVAEPGHGFVLRLATRLVHIYTNRGDTVMDLDNDPHLQHAAITAGRFYLATTDQTALNDLDSLAAPVGLIALRWPTSTTPDPATHLADLFAACWPLVSGDTSVVVAVSSFNPDNPASTFSDHVHALCVAGDAIGLTHLLQIVGVSGSHDGDQFLYYATADEAADVVD